jgi:hypothetical protein
MLARFHVQPHDIDQLVLEARIMRALESALRVRLDPVAPPHTRRMVVVLRQRCEASCVCSRT